MSPLHRSCDTAVLFLGGASSVLTVKLAVPLASMVMERERIWPLPAKSPLSMIFTLTLMGYPGGGAGVAVTLKLASPPSRTTPPPVTLTTGMAEMGGGGVMPSSSTMVILVLPWDPTV